ncbi:NAD-P-binding protein [Hysterangium stoloniferum]|nr:NAD-P-binding protein [Hysterangium stoloniferum]
MSTWLVTGTSRGIGLGFVRHIVSKGGIVFAGARAPEAAVALRELQDSSPPESIHILQLDITDEESIRAAILKVDELLQGRGLDYLVNNAASGPDMGDAASTLDAQHMLDVFKTNVVGPAMIFKACVSLLERSERPNGPVVMNMGTITGSILSAQGDTLPPGYYLANYAISKAGLNMLTVKQAKEKTNMIVFVMSPGWVKTKMGGEGAVLDVSDTVSWQYDIIVTATATDSGTFKQYDGAILPW